MPRDWLSRCTLACAAAAPVLLIAALSIHVAGDRCSFADPNRPGLHARMALWQLAAAVALTGVLLAAVGLWRRRSVRHALALVVVIGELGVVLLAALGIDPCGLS